MNFDYKNSYTLALMTTAFVVGEIAHFLIGEYWTLQKIMFTVESWKQKTLQRLLYQDFL